MSEVRAHSAERETTLAQNAAYEAQIVSLKKQFEDIDSLKADLSDIVQAVPASAQMPALLGELNQVAASSQVVISAFTANDAQAYDPALLAVVDTAVVAPEATPTPAPSAATDADAVAANAVTAGVAGVGSVGGVDPRITPSNFIAIPISITVDAPYDNVLDFVSGVQSRQRLVLVTAVSTTVPTVEGSVTGTITAFVYVLLDSNAEAAEVQ
nr:type 4a pilus biogenesis protein PilO [Cryobacterium roopkundense]